MDWTPHLADHVLELVERAEVGAQVCVSGFAVRPAREVDLVVSGPRLPDPERSTALDMERARQRIARRAREWRTAVGAWFFGEHSQFECPDGEVSLFAPEFPGPLVARWRVVELEERPPDGWDVANWELLRARSRRILRDYVDWLRRNGRLQFHWPDGSHSEILVREETRGERWERLNANIKDCLQEAGGLPSWCGGKGYVPK